MAMQSGLSILVCTISHVSFVSDLASRGCGFDSHRPMTDGDTPYDRPLPITGEDAVVHHSINYVYLAVTPPEL